MTRMEQNTNHGKIGKQRHLKPWFGMGERTEAATAMEQMDKARGCCVVRGEGAQGHSALCFSVSD